MRHPVLLSVVKRWHHVDNYLAISCSGNLVNNLSAAAPLDSCSLHVESTLRYLSVSIDVNSQQCLCTGLQAAFSDTMCWRSEVTVIMFCV